MDRQDYFSLHELYYLMGAFDGTTLIGLPSLEQVSLPRRTIWEDTKEALTAKGLLEEDGQLTDAGFVLVEVLKEYCLGQSLTIINNFYLMLSRDRQSTILIVDTAQGYQLARLSALGPLKLIQEKIPMTLREPLDDETSFLSLEMTLIPEIETVLASDQTLVVQHYPLLAMLETQHRKELKEQWFFAEWEGQLLGYNAAQKTLFRFSQYYFLERLYTWLGIPFREEDFDTWHNFK